MRPILLLAETGIVVRNLLLGTFADELLEHRPLVVAVPKPDDPRLRALVSGRSLTFAPYFLQRLEAPRNRLEKLTRWQTYVYRFKVAEKGTSGARLQIKFDGDSASLLGRTGMRVIDETGRFLAKTGLMAQFDDLFVRAVARKQVTKKWRQLLREIDPAVVLSTTLTLTDKNLFSGDLPPVIAAQAEGIPVGTLIQSWDNLSSKAAVLPPELDRYWTWNDYMTGELKSLYPRIDPERISIVGSPQFDFHRAANCEDRASFMARFEMDPDRPFVLMGTGTPSRIPDEPRLFLEIARALRDVAPDVQVLVRLHPKDDGTRWDPLADEVRDLGVKLQNTAPAVHMDHGGFVPAREFYRDQVSTLVHAAVIVNTASTLTVDAAILDRPIVCLAYDFAPDPRHPGGRGKLFIETTHYAPLVATRGVRVVQSTPETVAAILRYLREPTLDSEERRKIVAIVAGEVDGGAGRRLAHEVVNLAANR
jgi:hypothetical protein